LALMASLARRATDATRSRYSDQVTATTDMDTADRIGASDAACDAAIGIERLQQTETWLLLSPEVRREVCRAHALLNGLAAGLAPAQVPA
jgi:hypothetical protein